MDAKKKVKRQKDTQAKFLNRFCLFFMVVLFGLKWLFELSEKNPIKTLVIKNSNNIPWRSYNIIKHQNLSINLFKVYWLGVT